MARKLKVVALLSLISVVGCVFAGFKSKPPESALWRSQSATAGARKSCFTAYLYQPSHQRRTYLRESLDEVCSIFGSEEFRAKVRAEELWLTRATRCSQKEREHGEQAALTGEDIIHEVLDGNFEGIHYFDNRNIRANATTDVCPNRTSIDPGRIDQWAQDTASKADYLNTLSHELTHILVTDPNCDCTDQSPCWIRFTDDDHDECTEKYLVSYRLGDMVECFYLMQHERKDFDACMQAVRGKRNEQCKNKVDDIVQSCQADAH